MAPSARQVPAKQSAALINAATGYLVGGEVQGRWGSAHPSLVPYQAFRARDGYLMVGAGNERLWKAFCEVLGAPEWTDDPRYDSNARRVASRTELVREIEARLQAHHQPLNRAAVANESLHSFFQHNGG